MRRTLLFALIVLLATTAAQAAQQPHLYIVGSSGICNHARIEQALAHELGVVAEFAQVSRSDQSQYCDGNAQIRFDFTKLEAFLRGTRGAVLLFEGNFTVPPSSSLAKAFTSASKYNLLVVPGGNPGTTGPAQDSCTELFPVQAIRVGVKGDRTPERGRCLDLSVEISGGSINVELDGVVWGFGGSSGTSTLVAVRATALAWASGMSPDKLKSGFALSNASLTEGQLFAPHVMDAALRSGKLDLSVDGPAVWGVYRGVQCSGNPLALVATGSSATVALPRTVKNVCVKAVGDTQTFTAGRGQ